MIPFGQSELAMAMSLRGQNSEIRTALNIASKELSTGQKSDLDKATGGDLARLFSIDHSLLRLDAESEAMSVAAGKTSLAQISLDQIHSSLVEHGPQLLSAVERRDAHSMQLIGESAANKLGAVVASINTQYGRHSIFAGAAVDSTPVASAQTLTTDIAGLVSTAVDANAAITAIDSYFYSVGGGFETGIYLGSTEKAPPLLGVDGIKADYSIAGDALELRDALRSLVIAAVIVDSPGALSAQDQVDLLREAATSSIAAVDGIIRLRGEIGNTEEVISRRQAENQAKTSLFDLERSAILSTDPYEVATRFEALQGQLQTVYTLTARLSGLSLTNFLR